MLNIHGLLRRAYLLHAIAAKPTLVFAERLSNLLFDQCKTSAIITRGARRIHHPVGSIAVGCERGWRLALLDVDHRSTSANTNSV